MQSVQQNGSIYIHVYFTKSGFHPDPRQKALYRRLATVHMSRSKSLPAARPAVQAAGILGALGQWTGLRSQAHKGGQAACAQQGWDRQAGSSPSHPVCLCGPPQADGRGISFERAGGERGF